MTTYPDARAAFLDGLVRADDTIRIYGRATELFLEFTSTPLQTLDRTHTDILVQFAKWLLKYEYDPEHNPGETLKPTTVKLYLRGVRRWFEWMGVHEHFPLLFPLAKALWSLDDALAANIFKTTQRPPEPPEHIEETITYYDTLQPPDRLKSEDALRRWGITNIRNRTLMRVLAETGGRISEVLRLNVGDFPSAVLPEPGERARTVHRVWVEGKGGHGYYLRFLLSLSFIRAYITVRQAGKNEPLFVSHYPTADYEGKRLSRRAAHRVVAEAAQAVGVTGVSPHQFRHYVATKLVNEEYPLDVVQDYLGHRSVDTTRSYYAKTDQDRVDKATESLKFKK
jgi:integrase